MDVDIPSMTQKINLAVNQGNIHFLAGKRLDMSL